MSGNLRIASAESITQAPIHYPAGDDESARNRAIGELVLECPPSLVAEALGYSAQVAFLHADKAAEPWARYAGRSITSP